MNNNTRSIRHHLANSDLYVQRTGPVGQSWKHRLLDSFVEERRLKVELTHSLDLRFVAAACWILCIVLFVIANIDLTSFDNYSITLGNLLATATASFGAKQNLLIASLSVAATFLIRGRLPSLAFFDLTI